MSESEGGIRGGRVLRAGAWARYGVAVGAVVVAAALTELLYAAGFGFALPFALFFGPAALASMVAGRGPGLLTVALSAVVGNFLFVPPLSAPSLDASGLLQTLVFVLVALFIVQLTDRRRRAEQDARESGRWLSTTLRSIGDAVIATDAAGRVRFMNPTAQELTGWSETEARGRPLAEVFPIVNEETGEAVESPAERVIREGVVVGLANHTILLSKDGRRVPIDDSAAPIRDEAGATAGVVMVFHDITERRRSERALGESEARYRAVAEESLRLAAIVESSEDAIIGKTLEGVITSWNASAERIYGYTPEEAVGRHITLIVPPERHAEVESFLEQIRRGQKVEHREAVRVRKDGTRIFVSITISPVKTEDGRIVGASTIARDVTGRLRSEEAVRESERRYRYLADAMPQIVWTARPDGYLDYYNRRWHEYTGLAPEQTEGWGWQHVVHPEDLERCVRRWARSVETGEPFEVEYRFRRGSDGAYRWHLGRAGAQRDEGGRVLRWYGTSTDIDDQKRTEEALRFLAEADAVLASSLDFERTLESVARLAVPRLADFCLVDMADGAGPVRRMVVAHSDPEKEERWREMQRRTPLDPEAAEAIPKVLRTGKPELYAELTEEMFGGDGGGQLGALREFGVGSAMVVPLLARGRTIGALSFVAAESGRRYTTHDLATASDLARRAALAIDNAQLYRRTEEANRTKDEFLATLSHELRTPLTPITGWVHMLRSGRVAASELPHGLDVIERNSQSLTRLINDLLDMSAIMSGKMRIERAPVALSAVIEEAVESARAEAERRRLNVRLEVVACGGGDGAGPYAVSGDRTRLLQVFANLLNNAVKFSPGGGTVRVSCRRDGATAQVEVADEGRGIEPEFLPHVFERFRQADSTTTRQHGGLGLGLALVKSFVEAHGGQVRAESDGDGRGSRFTVTLPLLRLDAPAGASRGAAAGARPEPAKPRRPRLLVVEDARDTLEMLEAVFASRGFDVTLCETADEALGVASSGRFDIIVSDIGLPNTDGYELMRRLRGLPALRDVPAVALTGYAAQKDKDAALSSGFDLHIPKPVDPVALADAVEQLLRSKRRQS